MDFGKFLSPRLSTVHQHKKELGVAAANTILELINDKNSKTTGKVFTPYLVENQSVKGC